MRLFRRSCIAVAIVLLAVASATAQVGPGPDRSPEPLDPAVKRTFVPLPVPSALYEPIAPSGRSRVAAFVMHAGASYLSFSACTE